jgi:hypothetical protein
MAVLKLPLLTLALALAACTSAPPPAAPAPPAALPTATPSEAVPRLLVIVTIDQCRADYLDRFLPLLPEGGLRRLLAEGAVFPDAAHTHTVTSTAPGHAAIATGCLPARAGVPENEFLDERGKRSSPVADKDSQLVGSVQPLPRDGISARGLERPALGDLLQRCRGDDALVCSIAWKDRSALLMGGRDSDGSYWVETHSGSWVTTDAVRPQLPGWLATLNLRGSGPPRDGSPWTIGVRSAAGTSWERTLDDAVALRYAGPDAAPGETDVPGLRSVFPHALPAAPPDGGTVRDLSRIVALTPRADVEVLAAVAAALEHEQLGRDEVPDLLCVGFSALDYAGHAFGPQSQEVLEVFLAADRRVAELLALLDARVGKGRWTLALTADHGVAELPEQSGGLRLTQEELRAALETALVARLGPPPPATSEAAPATQPATPPAKERRWIRGVLRPSVWLDPDTVQAAGLALPAVAEELARVLAAQPGIELAATRAQLAAVDTAAAGGAAAGSDLAALAADVHPTRSGDVLFLVAPGTVLVRDVAADHGTHHAYDRRVPLILCGAGIKPGTYEGPAAPIDIAPTLAQLAGLPPPEGMDGHVLTAALLADR